MSSLSIIKITKQLLPYMRRISKVVFQPEENNYQRVDTSYKAITVFIIPKLLKDVYNLNVLFCRRQQNNNWYRKYNYGTGLKQNRIFNTSTVVRGCATNCLILHLICLGCSPDSLPHQQSFRKISKLSLLLVKHYVRYNNINYLLIFKYYLFQVSLLKNT